MTRRLLLLLLLVTALTGCRLKDDTELEPIPAPPDVAAPPPDAARTPSGLASKVLRPGTGNVRPTADSRVTVHYTGWTTDGRMFDSSVARGTPIADYPISQFISGWTEGLQLMVAGEQRRFWIPGHLAYDKSPDPSAPRGMLVFDVELIEVN
jgi:peptidylprolyl isomerase